MSNPLTLAPGTLTCYFVRHGERIDHVDDAWKDTAQVPYDPPLTAHGKMQAYATGSLIYDYETAPSAAHAKGIRDTDYLVLTSPFLRCAQTAELIAQGLQDRHQGQQQPISVGVAVEPGLCELMNDTYFDSQVPHALIGQRTAEIKDGWVCSNMAYNAQYQVARDELPQFPEHFQDMMARFVSTLDHVATQVIGRQARERMVAGPGSAVGRRRMVVIMVTHGAGVGSLLWATTLKPGFNDVDYCALTRAEATARRHTQPLPPFGSSRIPAFSWTVGPRAHTQHLAKL
ncbi:hypothetical protein GGI07_004346 [Coemansia sp. Benny D115]|nr:hypothetical protein GGI07_004346 [Coemansia sp. Benny D115]